ncbi:MAG: MFS transporter [Phycisphaerales bacterium]|nr:MFS transporter [Phycisphaerales bacterium]
MNRTALFAISCISLLTTSMVFSIRGDIETAMSAAFHLSKEQMGLIWGPSFWGFTIAIFVCGMLVDILGMKVLHALSSLGYIAGVTLVLLAPPPEVDKVESIFAHTGTIMLYSGFLLMGLAQGIVEGVINPLVATMYSDNKVHKLNVLHAWWPGGLIIGGLAAYFMTQAGITDWKLKLGLILVPASIYLVGVLSQKYPKTERVASGVSTGTMVGQAFRPLFLILLACMWLTTATELGPDQWFPSIMKDLTNLDGILFLVYTAGLMFVLRFFAGPIAHKISPPTMLVVCSILSAIGLYWLGSLQKGTSAYMAFAAATVFAIGKTFYWPTMLGITSEQYPRGGSLLMNLMGGAGMLAIAIALPLIGSAFDKKGAGAALQYVAILPVILIFVFAGIAVYFKYKGGYKPVKIEGAAEPQA